MSSESVGFCATGDRGTRRTAGDGGGIYNCGGRVGGSGGPNGHGVVSSPSIYNTGGGSENEDCGLHFDFDLLFWFVGLERYRDWEVLKGY